MHVLPVITPRGSPNVGETIVELQPAIRIKVVLNLHNRRPVDRFKSGIRCCPKGVVWIMFSIDNSRHKRVSVSS
jgi:hypothetical protein